MEGNMGLLLLATAISAAFFLQAAPASAGVPAIYVFGDSTADVGNNNYLPGDQAKANFPPYGIDFPQHRPTGRFSNGYIGVDILAKKLGFKRSPPAYLSISSDAQILEGVNFASGASGILDATGENISIPMNTQIKDFEDVIRRLKSQVGDAAADHILSKSLFVFMTGANDLFGFAIATASGLRNKTEADQFITLLAQQFKNQLQTLYKLGARKFVVFGSSQIGCIPLVRRINPSGDCIEDLNELSLQFSQASQVLLRDLASTSHGMSYTFVNGYNILSAVTSEPLKYGFKELKNACCGAGRFNAESACTSNVTYCSNRRDHFFWDASHPTQASYRVIVHAGYHGGWKFAMPVNIEQLAES